MKLKLKICQTIELLQWNEPHPPIVEFGTKSSYQKTAKKKRMTCFDSISGSVVGG